MMHSGKMQEINDKAFFPEETGAGLVELTQQSGLQESQHPRYSVVIESGQLLDTAELCLQELTLVSGVDYSIVSSSKGDSPRHEAPTLEYTRDIQDVIESYLHLLDAVKDKDAREIIKQQVTDLTDLQFKQLGGGV